MPDVVGTYVPDIKNTNSCRSQTEKKEIMKEKKKRNLENSWEWRGMEKQ